MHFSRWIYFVRPAFRDFGLVILVLFLMSLAGCKPEEITNVTNYYSNENLTDPAIQPQITSTYPLGGETGPFNVYTKLTGTSKAHFVLVFNKLMLRSSFTTRSVRASGFDRPVQVVLQSSGTAIYDNFFSFNIRDSIGGSVLAYPVARTCTVTVESTTLDINGNRLATPFSFAFTPEPYFRLVGFLPEDGTVDASIGTDPYAVFNSPVGSNILSSIHVSPDPGGQWKTDQFDSLSIMYTVSSGTLPFGTPFTLSVTSDARDAAGRAIDRAYASHFSSVAFRVSQTSPYAGQTGIDLIRYISLNFTGNVDSSTVRAAFSIVPSAQGSFNVYPYSYMEYYCGPISLRQNTTYTASVNSTLRSSTGVAVTPHSFSFTTDRFRVSYTYPSDGANNVPLYNNIQLEFNGNMDTSTVRSAFSITPPVPSGYFYQPVPGQTILYSSAGLAPSTLYTVTISTAMKTNAGDNLLTPYSFSFTTQSSD